jgi:hypothetical protein
MRYGARMRSSDRSGYGCGQRRQFKDDKNSRQGYRNVPHFKYQQLNVQEHLECSHEIHPTSSTSELEKNQETAPKEESPTEKVKMQTKTEPERERTEIFHRQQKESGDYFNTDYIHKSEVQQMVNLCSDCKHNLVGDWKSDSEEWQRDGFQANSKIDLEVAGNRLLMSRSSDDKARVCYGGQSRQPIRRLPKFNTLKPPTSVANRVTATYHDLLSPCKDLPPLHDIEPGLLHLLILCTFNGLSLSW